MPAGELVRDAVVTAGYAVIGRGNEYYDPADDERALRILEQLGCRRIAERAYGTLSEGERKRVQIARALMTDPELLLLDEPAAGLDLGAREALLRRLTRVMADPGGPVLVMVSHHVEEIPPGITHVLLLRDGAVVAAGPIEEVLTGEPLSRCFGLPLAVEQVGAGRYSARLAPPPPTRRPAAGAAAGADRPRRLALLVRRVSFGAAGCRRGDASSWLPAKATSAPERGSDRPHQERAADRDRVDQQAAERGAGRDADVDAGRPAR